MRTGRKVGMASWVDPRGRGARPGIGDRGGPGEREPREGADASAPGSPHAPIYATYRARTPTFRVYPGLGCLFVEGLGVGLDHVPGLDAHRGVGFVGDVGLL